MIEDKEIFLQFETDRDEGMRLLFDKYYRALVLYADHNVADLQVSEDIVQEFLMRLWETGYLSNVTDTTLKSYLFVSVRNACYTYVHKKDILRDGIEVMEADVAEDAVINLNQQIVSRVMSVIEHLPQQTRLVLECVLINDRKYKEAAKELNVSVNTVKTLLKRGMNVIREEFREEGDLLLLFWSRRIFEDVRSRRNRTEDSE